MKLIAIVVSILLLAPVIGQVQKDVCPWKEKFAAAKEEAAAMKNALEWGTTVVTGPEINFTAVDQDFENACLNMTNNQTLF